MKAAFFVLVAGVAGLRHEVIRHQANATRHCNSDTDPTCPKKICQPVCTWHCTNPKCERHCSPVCAAPICKTFCAPIDLKTCNTVCRKPDCTVICPKSCAFGNCPKCQTVCGPPPCETKCQQDCTSKCADPICTYDCDKPAECPKPDCHLNCDNPCQNAFEGVNSQVPTVAGSVEVASGTANIAPMPGNRTTITRTTTTT